MACCDFPCCGHENGCCPDFDASGRQLNMVCTCGKKLPVNSRFSICDGCMVDPDDPDQFLPSDDDEFAEEDDGDRFFSERDENADFERVDEYYGHDSDF